MGRVLYLNCLFIAHNVNIKGLVYLTVIGALVLKAWCVSFFPYTTENTMQAWAIYNTSDPEMVYSVVLQIDLNMPHFRAPKSLLLLDVQVAKISVNNKMGTDEGAVIVTDLCTVLSLSSMCLFSLCTQ